MKSKTHKATQKRFKVTGTGKVRHNRQKDNSHLKGNKDRAQKSRLNGKSTLANHNEAKKMISYMSK